MQCDVLLSWNVVNEAVHSLNRHWPQVVVFDGAIKVVSDYAQRTDWGDVTSYHTPLTRPFPHSSRAQPPFEI